MGSSSSQAFRLIELSFPFERSTDTARMSSMRLHSDSGTIVTTWVPPFVIPTHKAAGLVNVSIEFDSAFGQNQSQGS